MDFDRWIRKIHSKLPPGSEIPEGHSSIYKAYTETVKTATGKESADELCARAAQRTVKIYDEEHSEVKLPGTPGDRILTDSILRALKPEVESLRREEFGGPGAPFEGDMADAARWVEETQRTDVELWKADGEKRAALEEVWRLKDLHFFEEVQIDLKPTLLPYQRPGEEYARSAPTIPGTYLRRLALATDRLARHSGFPQDAFVMYLLTGIPPRRSRARITRRANRYTVPDTGEQIQTTTATVHILAPDLSDKELRLLNAALSGHIGGKGSKDLTNEDEVLWSTVKDMGGVPSGRRGKGLFWKEVAHRLEEDPAYSSATTPDAIRNRYRRILERLSLSPGPPKTLPDSLLIP